MQGRSFLKLLPKRLQRTIINKEGRSDTPGSHPLADNTCAADLPDTLPPSYEEACLGFSGVSIGAAAATKRPQDARVLRIINEVISRVNRKLEDVKQLDDSIDVLCISSRIRQLCDFAACRIAADCQRHPYACFVVRRRKTQREVERLFRLVSEMVDWERQDGTRVVCITTCAFRETVSLVLGEEEHPTYWQACAGACRMKSVVYRTAGQILECLVEEKERVRFFAEAAGSDAKAAKDSLTIARCDILIGLL